ncbi:MAG: FAD-binding oxidoreductase [Nitrospirota bacterium]
MPKQSYQGTVTDIETLTPTVKVFRLAFEPATNFSFIAGQYVMVDVLKDGAVIHKPYSIASPPHQKDIDLCIKYVEGGYVSTYFHTKVRVGDVLTVHEALGFFVDRGGPHERVYVGTGTGIAPIRSMILDLYHAGFEGPMSVYFGVRYEDELLYEPDWRRLEAEHPAFRFIPVVSRPKTWTGRTGWVQDALRDTLRDPASKEVYVCGLVPMVKAVKPLLMELGVPRQQIHTEKYI